MATDNYTILHDIWLKGTNDYQQRIPEPTQTNIDSTMGALFDPMNLNYFMLNLCLQLELSACLFFIVGFGCVALSITTIKNSAKRIADLILIRYTNFQKIQTRIIIW